MTWKVLLFTSESSAVSQNICTKINLINETIKTKETNLILPFPPESLNGILCNTGHFHSKAMENLWPNTFINGSNKYLTINTKHYLQDEIICAYAHTNIQDTLQYKNANATQKKTVITNT